MAVDIKERDSPGWWMQRLAAQLRADRPRLQLLQDWYDGEPPVAKDDENYRKYREMAKQSRTNMAALSVDARRNRLRMRGIRTSVDSDLEGDEIAWNLLVESALPTESGTCHRLALTMSRAYVVCGIPEGDLVAPGDEDGGDDTETARGDTDGEAVSPRATVEDPRDVTHVTDAFGRVRAALMLTHDDENDLDMAILWRPGKKHVATRERSVRPGSPRKDVNWSAAAFTLDETLEEDWDPALGVPVVPFVTEDGKGVFEKHIGLLERIDRGTFRRDTIALLQAFKQLALIGDMDDAEDDTEDEDDEDGYGADAAQDDDAPAPRIPEQRRREIDDVLTADPGAIWTIPEGMKFWESRATDLTPLQVSKRDDVKEFAAVTFTPLSMVTPDAAAQSAEGASLQREGLLFAVEDLWDRFGAAWARVTSLLLAMAGETERAKLRGILLDWVPAERHSLGQRAQAAVAATSSKVPWETVMTDMWGFGPEKVARMRQQRLEDLLLNATPADLEPKLVTTPVPEPVG